MSRKNRERRKWHCPGCGNRLDPAVARLVEEGLAAKPGPPAPLDRVAHHCGRCGAWLYEEADRFRVLTPNELFKLYLVAPVAPDAMAAVEAMPPDLSGAVVADH